MTKRGCGMFADAIWRPVMSPHGPEVRRRKGKRMTKDRIILDWKLWRIKTEKAIKEPACL
jgi:hypothetical protein